jgi:hypothetical protein
VQSTTLLSNVFCGDWGGLDDCLSGVIPVVGVAPAVVADGTVLLDDGPANNRKGGRTSVFVRDAGLFDDGPGAASNGDEPPMPVCARAAPAPKPKVMNAMNNKRIAMVLGKNGGPASRGEAGRQRFGQ